MTMTKRRKGPRTPGPDGRAHGRDPIGVLLAYFPPELFPYKVREVHAYMGERFDAQFKEPESPKKLISSFAGQVVSKAKSDDDRKVTVKNINYVVLARMYSLGISAEQNKKGKWRLSLDYLQGQKSRQVTTPHYLAGHIWSRFCHHLMFTLYTAYPDRAKHLARKNMVEYLQEADAVGWARTDMLRVLRTTLGGSKRKEKETIVNLSEHCADLFMEKFGPIHSEAPTPPAHAREG
jgi:hypothetical protein